jgi:uncharacterized protein YPO0396
VSDRPSDGFTFDELREEYDWMSDFMGRMTERIRGNADVHSLAAYVGKLEAENAKLREQIYWLKKGDIPHVLTDQEYIDQCERERLMQVSIDALDKENAKLRELIRELFRDFANADYELKSRCGRTFMAVTRYLPRLQELEVEP